MKRHKTFRGMAWESLEGRALLNGGYGSAQLARAQHHAAQVAAHAAGVTAAQQQRAARRASAGLGNTGTLTQGAVSQGYTPATPNIPVSSNPPALNLSTPGVRPRILPAGTSNPLGLPGPSPTSYNLSIASATLGGGPSVLNTASPYAATIAGLFPSMASGGGHVVSAYNPGPGGAATPVAVTLGAAPTGGGTATAGGVAASAVGSQAVSVAPTTGTPTNPPATPQAPVMPPMPVGLLDGVTLSAADVANLKKTMDTFAASYTSGADAAKDKAATDALKAGLDDLAQSAWDQSHVATAASVSQLQQTVDGFAKAYTSGANPTQDKAAWKALQAGMSVFGTGLQGTNPAGPGGLWSGGPGAMPPGMGGGPSGLKMLDGGLLGGQPLTPAEVTTLHQAVTDFTAAYTSGTDAAKDQSAANALATSLGNLASAHWAAANPLPAGANNVGAPPAGTVYATGAAVPRGPAAQPLTVYMAPRTASGQVVYTNPGTPTGKA